MSRNAFTELEFEYNEHLARGEEAAHARALQQQEAGSVRWMCPYCTQEVADEYTPHCGEAHGAIPMPPEDE